MYFTDLLLAKFTCMVLQKLANSKTQKGQLAEKPFRLPSSHQVFQQMSVILTREITNLETVLWSPFAEQAIATTYMLSEQPDEVCGTLLKRLTEKVFGSDTPPPSTDRASVNTSVENGGPASGSVDTLPDDFDPQTTSSQGIQGGYTGSLKPRPSHPSICCLQGIKHM